MEQYCWAGELGSLLALELDATVPVNVYVKWASSNTCVHSMNPTLEREWSQVYSENVWKMQLVWEPASNSMLFYLVTFCYAHMIRIYVMKPSFSMAGKVRELSQLEYPIGQGKLLILTYHCVLACGDQVLDVLFLLVFPVGERTSMPRKVRTEQRIVEAERVNKIMLSLLSVRCLLLWVILDVRQCYVPVWKSNFTEIVEEALEKSKSLNSKVW